MDKLKALQRLACSEYSSVSGYLNFTTCVSFLDQKASLHHRMIVLMHPPSYLVLLHLSLLLMLMMMLLLLLLLLFLLIGKCSYSVPSTGPPPRMHCRTHTCTAGQRPVGPAGERARTRVASASAAALIEPQKSLGVRLAAGQWLEAWLAGPLVVLAESG